MTGTQPQQLMVIQDLTRVITEKGSATKRREALIHLLEITSGNVDIVNQLPIEIAAQMAELLAARLEDRSGDFNRDQLVDATISFLRRATDNFQNPKAVRRAPAILKRIAENPLTNKLNYEQADRIKSALAALAEGKGPGPVNDVFITEPTEAAITQSPPPAIAVSPDTTLPNGGDFVEVTIGEGDSKQSEPATAEIIEAATTHTAGSPNTQVALSPAELLEIVLNNAASIPGRVSAETQSAEISRVKILMRGITRGDPPAKAKIDLMNRLNPFVAANPEIVDLLPEADWKSLAENIAVRLTDLSFEINRPIYFLGLLAIVIKDQGIFDDPQSWPKTTRVLQRTAQDASKIKLTESEARIASAVVVSLRNSHPELFPEFEAATPQLSQVPTAPLPTEPGAGATARPTVIAEGDSSPIATASIEPTAATQAAVDTKADTEPESERKVLTQRQLERLARDASFWIAQMGTKKKSNLTIEDKLESMGQLARTVKKHPEIVDLFSKETRTAALERIGGRLTEFEHEFNRGRAFDCFVFILSKVPVVAFRNQNEFPRTINALKRIAADPARSRLDAERGKVAALILGGIHTLHPNIYPEFAIYAGTTAVDSTGHRDEEGAPARQATVVQATLNDAGGQAETPDRAGGTVRGTQEPLLTGSDGQTGHEVSGEDVIMQHDGHQAGDAQTGAEETGVAPIASGTGDEMATGSELADNLAASAATTLNVGEEVAASEEAPPTAPEATPTREEKPDLEPEELARMKLVIEDWIDTITSRGGGQTAVAKRIGLIGQILDVALPNPQLFSMIASDKRKALTENIGARFAQISNPANRPQMLAAIVILVPQIVEEDGNVKGIGKSLTALKLAYHFPTAHGIDQNGADSALLVLENIRKTFPRVPLTFLKPHEGTEAANDAAGAVAEPRKDGSPQEEVTEEVTAATGVGAPAVTIIPTETDTVADDRASAVETVSQDAAPEWFEHELLTQQPTLQSMARFFTKSDDRAKDLVQETLIKALKNWQHYAQGTNIKGWLTVIMRNTFLSEQRKKEGRNVSFDELLVTTQLSDKEAMFISPFIAPDAHIEILEAVAEIEKLPPPQRELIWLAIEGMTVEEMAEHSKIPVGTVKSRLSRGRARISQLLEDAAIIGQPKLPRLPLTFLKPHKETEAANVAVGPVAEPRKQGEATEEVSATKEVDAPAVIITPTETDIVTPVGQVEGGPEHVTAPPIAGAQDALPVASEPAIEAPISAAAIKALPPGLREEVEQIIAATQKAAEFAASASQLALQALAKINAALSTPAGVEPEAQASTASVTEKREPAEQRAATTEAAPQPISSAALTLNPEGMAGRLNMSALLTDSPMHSRQIHMDSLVYSLLFIAKNPQYVRNLSPDALWSLAQMTAVRLLDGGMEFYRPNIVDGAIVVLPHAVKAFPQERNWGVTLVVLNELARDAEQLGLKAEYQGKIQNLVNLIETLIKDPNAPVPDFVQAALPSSTAEEVASDATPEKPAPLTTDSAQPAAAATEEQTQEAQQAAPAVEPIVVEPEPIVEASTTDQGQPTLAGEIAVLARSLATLQGAEYQAAVSDIAHKINANPAVAATLPLEILEPVAHHFGNRIFNTSFSETHRAQLLQTLCTVLPVLRENHPDSEALDNAAYTVEEVSADPPKYKLSKETGDKAALALGPKTSTTSADAEPAAVTAETAGEVIPPVASPPAVSPIEIDRTLKEKDTGLPLYGYVSTITSNAEILTQKSSKTEARTNASFTIARLVINNPAITHMVPYEVLDLIAQNLGSRVLNTDFDIKYRKVWLQTICTMFPALRAREDSRGSQQAMHAIREIAAFPKPFGFGKDEEAMAANAFVGLQPAREIVTLPTTSGTGTVNPTVPTYEHPAEDSPIVAEGSEVDGGSEETETPAESPGPRTAEQLQSLAAEVKRSIGLMSGPGRRSIADRIGDAKSALATITDVPEVVGLLPVEIIRLGAISASRRLAIAETPEKQTFANFLLNAAPALAATGMDTDRWTEVPKTVARLAKAPQELGLGEEFAIPFGLCLDKLKDAMRDKFPAGLAPVNEPATEEQAVTQVEQTQQASLAETRADDTAAAPRLVPPIVAPVTGGDSGDNDAMQNAFVRSGAHLIGRRPPVTPAENIKPAANATTAPQRPKDKAPDISLSGQIDALIAGMTSGFESTPVDKWKARLDHIKGRAKSHADELQWGLVKAITQLLAGEAYKTIGPELIATVGSLIARTWESRGAPENEDYADLSAPLRLVALTKGVGRNLLSADAITKIRLNEYVKKIMDNKLAPPTTEITSRTAGASRSSASGHAAGTSIRKLGADPTAAVSEKAEIISPTTADEVLKQCKAIESLCNNQQPKLSGMSRMEQVRAFYTDVRARLDVIVAAVEKDTGLIDGRSMGVLITLMVNPAMGSAIKPLLEAVDKIVEWRSSLLSGRKYIPDALRRLIANNGTLVDEAKEMAENMLIRWEAYAEGRDPGEPPRPGTGGTASGKEEYDRKKAAKEAARNHK